MLISDLERRSGLSRDSIRFYERARLISATRRRQNGYREYDLDSLRELRFICAAREIGFTLEQIRTALPSLKARPRAAPPCWRNWINGARRFAWRLPPSASACAASMT